LGLGLAGMNLLLIALAVSAVNPRAGRSYHLGMALFVFIAYYNMLNVGQSWISTGRFDFLPFMVVLHGGVFLLAMLWLSIRHYNWSWRFLWQRQAPQNKGAA
jgi:lipopolysaccharide export system permease protein